MSYVYDDIPVSRVVAPPVELVPVIIEAGESLSTAAYIGVGELIGVILPQAWSEAGLTFMGSVDGSNFFDIYDAADGGFERYIPAASLGMPRFMALDAGAWLMVTHLKLRSGYSALPVPQPLDRTLQLVTIASVEAFEDGDESGGGGVATSNTLTTVGDYIARARYMLQDRVEEYRYPTIDLMSSLNMGFLEMRRLRPDLFLGDFSNVPSYDDVAQVVDLDPQFRVTLVYYIVGQAQLSDQEDTQDARATVFLNKFIAQLTSLPS